METAASSEAANQAAWLAVDWGTSNLRVWAMGADGNVLQALTSDQGMSALSPDDYEAVLIGRAGDYLGSVDTGRKMPVLICGMAGSRSGWKDAGYIDVPVNAGELSGSTVSVPTEDTRLSVHILSGLRQVSAADVMRGEETQLAGFAARHPGYVGYVCLPGTHSKWVSFEAGRIASSQTIMTGELFALLAKQSILKSSVADPDHLEAALPTGDFLAGVERGHDGQGGALGQLFQLRAEDLVGDGRDELQRLSILSGLLIGSEFAAVAPHPDRPITFVGSSKLAPLYKRAARHLGFEAEAESGDELVLVGLRRAYEALKLTHGATGLDTEQ